MIDQLIETYSKEQFVYNPTVDSTPKLTLAAINNLQGKVSQILSDNVTNALVKDLHEGGEIGPILVNEKGVKIHTRINKYLWDKFGVKFYRGIKDTTDYLQQALDSITVDTIDYPVRATLTKKMDWRPGEFGDKDSCFFGGHSICRYWLNQLSRAFMMKVYTKDGKAFGRCLIVKGLKDHPELIALFNSYPGHKAGMYLELYANILKSMFAGVDPKYSKLTTVGLSNGSSEEERWFYTNNTTGTILSPEDYEIWTSFLFGFPKQKPRVAEIAGFRYNCNQCNEPTFDDDDGLVIQHLKDSQRKLQLCGRCAKEMKEYDHVICDCGATMTGFWGANRYSGFPGTLHVIKAKYCCAECYYKFVEEEDARKAKELFSVI